MTNNKLLYAPAVFAIEDEYQIFIRLKNKALVWIEIDGEKYYDHSNGVLCSSNAVHKVRVPAEVLEKAKHYKVCVRTLIKRLAYFSKCYDVETEDFSFYPVPCEGEIRICHVADVHGCADAAINAFINMKNEPHLLILNGDVIDDSSTTRNFNCIYKLCDKITHGEIPVVFSRGNHDLRGVCAEKLAQYIPVRDGKTYFTFRVVSLWGVVLDCGEDKGDSHEEYGHTVCCEEFRKDETAYLKTICESSTYNEKGIKHKIVVSHSPFTFRQPSPFDIERYTYKEWAELAGKYIKPEFILSGHLHRCGVAQKGSELDNDGIQPCPVILGSEMNGKRANTKFALAEIVLNDDGFNVNFHKNED